MMGIIPEMALTKGIDSFYGLVLNHRSIVGGINFVMIFLAIFSKEKVEDEMTTAIRVNTLLYIVFFLFGIHVLLYLPGEKIHGCIISIKDFFMQDFGILALTYAILFKLMIWINMWRMRNEE